MPKKPNMLKKAQTRLVSAIVIKILERISREKLAELLNDMEYSSLTGKINVYGNWSFNEVKKIKDLADSFNINCSSIKDILKLVK